VAAPCAPSHCVRGPVRKGGSVRPLNSIVRSHWEPPVQIFRREPSLALKSGVLAAVVSWLIVAIPSVPECWSDEGACFLVSPAVWLYWAPVFLVAWAGTAALMRAVEKRKKQQ